MTISAISEGQLLTDFQQLQLHLYFFIICPSIFVWDYIITLDREISFVWPARWDVSKVLFLLNRYTPLIDCTYFAYFILDSGNETICFRSYEASGYLLFFGFTLSEIILLFRTCLLYKNRQVIVNLLSIFFIGLVISHFVILHIYYLGEQSLSVPGINVCMAWSSSYVEAIGIALIILYETVIFTLLVYKSLCFLRHRRTPFISVLYRDGIMIYSVMLISAILNLAVILAAPSILQNSMFELQRTLQGVLCSRMLLNARGAIVDPNGKIVLVSQTDIGSDTVTYYVYEDQVKAVPAISDEAWDDMNIRDPSHSIEVEPPSPVVNIAETGSEARDDISEMVFSPGKQQLHGRSNEFELTYMSAFPHLPV